MRSRAFGVFVKKKDLMRIIRTLLSTAGVLAPALVAGCSSSSSASGHDEGATVSFATDVMPIFQQSCALAVCHGQPNNATVENLYLGDATNNTPDVIARVYEGIVGVPSLEDPPMNVITASSTADSYLSFKLQGQQDQLSAQCARAAASCADCAEPTPCGSFMPFGGTLFSQESPLQFATIQRWIAQGAKNN
jgi:hypothetical protein